MRSFIQNLLLVVSVRFAPLDFGMSAENGNETGHLSDEQLKQVNPFISRKSEAKAMSAHSLTCNRAAEALGPTWAKALDRNFKEQDWTRQERRIVQDEKTRLASVRLAMFIERRRHRARVNQPDLDQDQEL